jgi:hypothetical protein
MSTLGKRPWLVILMLALGPGSGRAEESLRLFPPEVVRVSEDGSFHFSDPLLLRWPAPEGTISCRLDALESEPAPAFSREAFSGDPRGPSRRDKFWAGAIAATAMAASAWNSFGDGRSRSFHVTDEGFFSPNTYVGGGDKVSHFVSYNFLSRQVAILYEKLNFSPGSARWGGFLVSSAAGFVTELGDGRGRYGFSFEDWLCDTLGAGAAMVTTANHMDDLIGFRFGPLPEEGPKRDTDAILGKDYSHEIYTADLKIGGLARRLHFDAGPAKFLMLSVTYGVKGYPYSAPALRERQVGIELGLNFGGILRAFGVPEMTWWGIPIYMVFDTIRFPYTSIGYYYDLNHHKWHGPSNGQTF